MTRKSRIFCTRQYLQKAIKLARGIGMPIFREHLCDLPAEVSQ
ncbi:hypothetical protein [Blastopirellula marina]|nr:hypothetical protein [Blastopirellula marina]